MPRAPSLSLAAGNTCGHTVRRIRRASGRLGGSGRQDTTSGCARRAWLKRKRFDMNVKQYLAAVRASPCVVCTLMGVEQSTPTEAHHVENVRDEDSDYATVSLCVDHHRGVGSVHGLSRKVFAMRYKLTDVDLMALTIKAVCKGML